MRSKNDAEPKKKKKKANHNHSCQEIEIPKKKMDVASVHLPIIVIEFVSDFKYVARTRPHTW